MKILDLASRQRLLLLVAGATLTVIAAVAAAPAAAQNGPFDLADDHFLCYKGKLTKGEPAAAPQNLTLVDAFESGDFDVVKERGSCNPADKNGEGIVDTLTHLTAYQIKAESGAPKHVKQLGVRVFNQFGDIFLDTLKVDRLLVPAAKDDNPANPLPAAPANSSHNVDHYKCYKVKVSRGTPKFPKGLQATVEDQWESPAKLYDLKKPKLLCLAVDKNGQGTKNPDAAQLCYLAKRAKGQPKHEKRKGVGFADQLVAHRLDSKKEELLCVPSLEDPPDQFCGDGTVNQAGEQCDGDASTCPSSPPHTCLPDCLCAPLERRCGDGVIETAFGETCELDSDCAPGESCTTSCTCMDSQCPDTMRMIHFAKVGVMMTVSDNAQGFTGVAHDSGIMDESETLLRLGAVSGAGPGACGEATIAGLDPSSRLCRCVNDHRQLCDQPNERDVDDCGGETCICYWNPVAPALSGNVPTCSLTEIIGPVTGSWNLDTGEGSVTVEMEQPSWLGGGVLTPCATCDGDVAMNDGTRDGTCNGGLDDGLPCDAMATNANFPVPGGGAYSIDCFPGGPEVISGLFVDVNYTTGARELPVAVPCGLNDSKLCHCGRCDNALEIACTSNADCAAVGGECGPQSATLPLPNACSDETCTDLGAGQGECLADPETYCDGLVRADGTGLIGCNTNSDCGVGALDVDGGSCELIKYKPCFPDDISLVGVADPAAPIVVSADCVPPSSNNPAANIVAGFPAPAVRTEQLATEFRCAGDAGSLYPACP